MSEKINNYFLVLFSLIPISIISGSLISLSNILLIDISFLILITVNKDYSFLKSKPVKYLFLLYLYLIFNSLISTDREIGLARNLGFIRMIILFVAFNYFFNQKLFLKKVLYSWSIILCFILLDVFFESLNGKNIFGFGGGEYGERLVSFFKDEPIIGGYINGFYLIIIGFLLNQTNFKNKNVIVFLSALFLIGIFLTGERSNTIRAFLGLIIFYLAYKEYGIKKKIIFFTSIFVFFLLLISNSQFLKMRYVSQIKSHLHTNQIYFGIYKSGFEVFKDNKIFGVGNKNYRIETCNLDKKENYICTTHPHQIYFEMLSEHGILGSILIFVVLYKIIFSKIVKTLRNNNYIMTASFIYLTLIFLPLLPSGAFFNDYMLTLFMINLSIFYSSSNAFNIFRKQE
jgi:O-antigen ligase